MVKISKHTGRPAIKRTWKCYKCNGPHQPQYCMAYFEQPDTTGKSLYKKYSKRNPLLKERARIDQLQKAKSQPTFKSPEKLTEVPRDQISEFASKRAIGSGQWGAPLSKPLPRASGDPGKPTTSVETEPPARFLERPQRYIDLS